MDPSYAERFGGMALLYGIPALVRFQTAQVAVVGIGGVGSWTAEALARSGIGRITLIDLDDICITNTNRQLHTTDATIGRSKVEVMAARLREIAPGAQVTAVAAYYTEANGEELLGQPFHAVVDAIDSVRQKAHLLATARRRGIPVVTVGGAGGRIDATRICAADLSQTTGDRLLSLTRKRLRSHFDFPRPGKGKFGIRAIYSDEPHRWPQPDGSICTQRQPGNASGINCNNGLGSAAHITGAFGLFAAGEVLRVLAGS